MKCNCNTTCIKTKKETLENITTRYQPCAKCDAKTLKKAIPLKKQIKLEKLNQNYKKCSECHKRHIDIVMAHVLKILIENNQISETASIRKVGTPLITPAIHLDRAPYLSKKSLVIIIKTCDEKTAQTIIDEVPEIKAVIKGDTNKTVGQIDEGNKINTYALLGGCDVRCDIQQTDVDPIIIYKPQSKIHIEYPKPYSPKIEILTPILEKYDNPTVLDSMCGPGTLGIYCLLKNASKVTFNDIYEESLNTLKTNLEINNISPEVYDIQNQNILDLAKQSKQKYDIGIIDAFPGINTQKYEKELKKICDEVIVI